MKKFLEKLKKKQDLSFDESKSAFNILMNGKATEEEIFDFAVENESQDLETNEEDYVVYCDQSALHILNNKIISKFGSTKSADLIWKSDTSVEVEKNSAEKLFKLLNALEDNDDVQGVSSNFEVNNSIKN